MKFRPVSDIHLEFYDSTYTLPKTEDEANTILLLAGDVGLLYAPKTYTNFIDDVCSRFKEVFWVEGNHEYYHGNIDKLSVGLIAGGWSNLHTEKLILEDEKIVVLGCTLWSNFNNENPLALLEANHGMNDFRLIRRGLDYSKFRAENAAAWHRSQKRWLIDYIDHYNKLDYTVIVVTHHHPSFQGIDEEFRGSILNYAYCSDLDREVSKYDIKYWICGHQHKAMRYSIGSTEVICNPLGYPGQVTNLDENLILEL